jgi:hypothetical protein
MKSGLHKLRRIAFVAATALALTACDMVSSMKDGPAQSEQAAEAIGKQVGNKPQIGFNYNNNTLVSVTVVFQKAPAVPLDELEKIARKEVRTAFKTEPTNLVISFVYAKAA